VIDVGARVGVRETRLVHGDAVLTEAHVRECAKPADGIACSSWPLETHGRGPVTQWDFLPDGEYYSIPWGCLVVRGFDNLLVAGRNLSATHAAQASVRVAGPCMAMGEAAGTGAAASLAAGANVRAVRVEALRVTLARHGALLDPALSWNERSSS
jgi:FAD dependent oxidoreductase